MDVEEWWRKESRRRMLKSDGRKGEGGGCLKGVEKRGRRWLLKSVREKKGRR